MEYQDVDENGSNNSEVVVIDNYSLSSVSIPNKFVQQHLPPIASGKSMIIEFEDCVTTSIFLCCESIERVQVLVKNLCAKDPKCLRLSKKEVEGNLDQHLIIQVGEEVIIPLHDPIRKKSFTVQLLHADEEEYHIRGIGWEEYVAQHNLFIFNETTIFVNKVILDPTAEVQLVNISYHYEITYQTRATNQPQRKLKLSGTTTETSSAPASTAAENSSAPASTTVDNSSAPASTAVDNSSAPASTAVDNSSGPAYTAVDNSCDDVYWLG
ncbi:hypothetical protein EJD97_017362 [Solanum chilense]|uniref:Uncharacterized protein n=1 Tax=Solanum chilense TaxID=4083 RepID=A0A6N2B5M1_SOLCI|nr:hypothetical protein EJD97_017362 [Solanum chilense]